MKDVLHSILTVAGVIALCICIGGVPFMGHHVSYVGSVAGTAK